MAEKESASQSASIVEQPRTVHTLLGSALSGLIARFPCHPIDTIKSRLQGSGGYRYDSIRHCFRTTIAEEGVRGLYRGFGIVAAVGTPAACLYLTSYDVYKAKLLSLRGSRDGTDLDFLGHFTAGMLAEATACLLFVPVDVIKERLQVQRTGQVAAVGVPSSAPPTYLGSFDAVKQIARSEGLSGLYKGYYVTLGSFGPFSALYFVFYERLKADLASLEGTADVHKLSTLGTIGASAGAGSAASVLTSPIDLAKLRLQTQRRLARGEPVPEGHLTGFSHAIRTVYSEGGVRALFRGAGARVAFHTPSTCITFTCFEECRKLMQRLVP